MSVLDDLKKRGFSGLLSMPLHYDAPELRPQTRRKNLHPVLAGVASENGK